MVACAFNSLLFRNVACPDYDMFTTNLVENSARMHAITRCLSGGPIYISDAPDSSPNIEVINWMCCSDGTTLSCRDTAVPVPRSLFHDPLNGNEPLVIYNTNGKPSASTSGILGIFFLSGGGDWDSSALNYLPNKIMGDTVENTSIYLRAGDVPSLSEFSGSRFLAILFFSKSVTILDSLEETMELRLSRGQSESVALLPLLRIGRLEIAILGFDGRINGAGAVLAIGSIDDSSMSLQVAGCGIFSVAVLPSVGSVRVFLNGNRVHYRNLPHSPESLKECRGKNLLELGFFVVEFEIPSGRNHHEIQIEFE